MQPVKPLDAAQRSRVERGVIPRAGTPSRDLDEVTEGLIGHNGAWVGDLNDGDLAQVGQDRLGLVTARTTGPRELRSPEGGIIEEAAIARGRSGRAGARSRRYRALERAVGTARGCRRSRSATPTQRSAWPAGPPEGRVRAARSCEREHHARRLQHVTQEFDAEAADTVASAIFGPSGGVREADFEALVPASCPQRGVRVRRSVGNGVLLRFEKLGGRGSNPESRLQRPVCCRLHHLPPDTDCINAAYAGPPLTSAPSADGVGRDQRPSRPATSGPPAGEAATSTRSKRCPTRRASS